MKHTNSVFKKALSVFLCAVMMLSVISVGIIIPEPKADALTVGQTISVNSVATLNSAIATANSAGANTITTIKLSGGINAGETAALTKITGYVVFDFNGCNIEFSYSGTSARNKDSNEYQLPSENKGAWRDSTEYLTTAMFNVGTTGTLQFINTSSTSAQFYVYTKNKRNDGVGSSARIATSSNGIYSEGTVIIGDKNNGGYNNFSIKTQSTCTTSTSAADYTNVRAESASFAVTINNSTSGRLYMYGGTVTAGAYSDGKRSGNLYSRCYALNIIACNTAEIYGGNVNIASLADGCGIRNADSTDTDDGYAYFAAIRANSPNVYIFNTTSSVAASATADTDGAHMFVANIWASSDDALPCVYGGSYTNTSSGSTSDAAWECNYIILGKFQYADGTFKPGDKSTSVTGLWNSGSTNGLYYKYRGAPTALYIYTIFHFADTNAENGIYPWNYDTFGGYLNARSSSHAYYSTACYSHINDGNNYAPDANHSYLRNGYNYTTWLGSVNMPVLGGRTYSGTGEAGLNASQGGSLFLYPNWVLTNYTITYDLNDTTGNNRASNASGAPTTYKITSTSALPTPTRAGYSFGGWLLDSKSVPATDTVTDAWMQGSTYPAGTSLTGKNGSIVLKATWTEIPYTVTFDYDNIPAGASGTKTTTTANYNVNSTFTFPTGCTKDYYTFINVWKVTGAAGSYAAGNTFTAGSTSIAGSYGSATFTAQYTPIEYTITFDSDFGAAVDPMTYNYESTSTLPATTRLGYTFAGWKPTAVSGNWNPTSLYVTNTSLNHMHGNVTLKAQWNSVSSIVTLALESGNTELNYAYSDTLPLDNPSKTGYTFAGWKVTGVPSYTSDIPTANRWIVDTVYSLGSEEKVTLPANKVGDVTLVPVWTPITYRIIYNTNGAAAISPKDYTIADAAFALPTPVRDGYSFAGWSVTSHDEVYNWTSSTYAGNQSVFGMYGGVTLYANWTAVGYTVTLNVNGGDALTDNTLTYTTEGATNLPVPTRTGYDFAGWKVTSVGSSSDWSSYTGRPADDIYTDALPMGHYGDIALTAQWTHKAYTITLNTSGTNGGARTYYIDSPSFTLGASELSGYTFKNWKVNADAGNWIKDTTYLSTAAIVNKYGDVALTAQFEPVTYTISYYNENGVLSGETDEYTIEDTVTLAPLTVNGYTFEGWKVKSVTSGGGWNVGDVLAAGDLTANMYYGNVELEPVLTPVEYKLTFVPDGGTSYPQKSYTIETADYVLPTPTKTGYDFAGWKVTTAAGSWTENAVFAAGTSVAGKYGSATLTATWTAKKYAITYNVGNTTLYPAGITKQGTYNATAPDLTDAEKAKPSDAQYDYTFDHWEPALGTVTGEATYTAVYTNTLRSYDITWMLPDDVGGTLANYTSETTPAVNYGAAPVYNGGVNPTLASDSPESYSWRFAGWATTAGGTVLETLPAVTGAATYYAVFTKVLAPEKVNWVIEGVTNTELWGIGETPSWQHETPSKPDANGYKYTFTGWTPAIVPVVQGNTYTYTAQFSSELQTYTYSFNANGAAETVIGGNYKMGDTVTFPTVTKTGYTFAGWKLDAAVGTWTADTVISAGDYVTNTLWGNVSFTAQWTPVDYTITFNNASSDDTVPAAKTYNIESTDALGTAARDGYELVGWNVAVASGNWVQGTNLAADYTLLNNYGNVTLTPVWQVKAYTINWVSDGVTQTSEVEFGSAILAFPPSSKMGYTADWDSEVPATMPAHDLTFTAVYTPVEYYVRVNVNGGSAVDNFYYTINGNNTLPVPTRDGADFAGWKVTAAAGNWSKNTLLSGGASLNGKYGNVSLTAQWNMHTCTVIWNAGDTVKTTVWYYGATPSFDGTPYKSPDAYNSYVFTGWDKEIVPVTEDEVTYTALFEETERIYTITWNIDGITTKEEYKYGDTPSYKGETPVRPSTVEYDFTFAGWSPAVGSVTADVVYVAQFDVFTKIQALSLDTSSMFLDLEQSKNLTASIYPSTATVRDVKWTSLSPDVVSIDASGKVSAVSYGVAVVKASSIDGKFASYCVVTVNPKVSNYVSISAGGVSTTQLPGTTIQLTATLEPDNVSVPGIVWRSSNPSVAAVDENGLVTYLAVGKAVISATASDGYSSGSVEVVVAKAEEEVVETEKTYLVTFAAAGTMFVIGENNYETLQVKCTEGQDIRFKVRDSEYFYVNANGSVLKPDANGVYTLKVDRNFAIITEIIPIGTDTVDENKDQNDSPSFWAKIQAFFRMIVEFFRNLFK